MDGIYKSFLTAKWVVFHHYHHHQLSSSASERRHAASVWTGPVPGRKWLIISLRRRIKRRKTC